MLINLQMVIRTTPVVCKFAETREFKAYDIATGRNPEKSCRVWNECSVFNLELPLCITTAICNIM